MKINAVLEGIILGNPIVYSKAFIDTIKPSFSAVYEKL